MLLLELSGTSAEEGNYDESKFKIYYPDTSLLIASLDEEGAGRSERIKNLGDV